MPQQDMIRNFRHNFIVNIADGAFFGFGLGFASFVTIIPLFVSTLTDSTTIIGLIAAMHVLGWQLPQLFTARFVARLRRYKPYVLMMTTHERWPFLGLAVVALLIPTIGKDIALAAVFILVAIHSFSGGLAGTAWQSMIGKIIPPGRVGTFYGTQSAAANLMASGSAVIAGAILVHFDSPYDFALCFFLTTVNMVVSWYFLWRTREPEHTPEVQADAAQRPLWQDARRLLARDTNYRWFIIARVLAQCAAMASGFYTIYAVRQLGIDEQTAGVMAGLLLIGQTIASPLLGIIGDRMGHRRVFIFGTLLLVLSVGLAAFAPTLGWFYLVFALAGFANAVLWTTSMSITLQFSTLAERPLYIGLTNTLVAPATFLAPIVGGWVVDAFSFQAMFALSILVGLAAVGLFVFMVSDPRQQQTAAVLTTEPAAAGMN